MTSKDYNIFQGDRFIDSMRSSGYKDTSYAVAELVDNAIDAKAKHIEILCREKINHVTNRYHLDRIAVLDDGHGMDSPKLRSSLLFGDGTRGKHAKEIGKYGMGLPNSSLSQCKRVEVYSWQKSADPVCSYIDVGEVKGGNRKIPIPKSMKIPTIWKETARHFSNKSGTLVVWSKLDRCSWTTSKKIIEHSQFLIGRIYRRFLHRGDITITMTTIRVDDNEEVIESSESSPMLPNDPMYLMVPSSTPGKWGNVAMFKRDTIYEETYSIDYEGQKHDIVVRYSIEKDELRAPENVEGDQGSTGHGKHARKNIGISIMRSDREIVLDASLVAGSDPRDRWWGAEMDIPSSLDLVVGLTNNKQQMDTLSAIMSTINLFGDDDTDENAITGDLSEQDIIKSQLFDMVSKISSHTRSMTRRIRATRSGTRSGTGKSELDKKIEGGIRQEQKEGKSSQSDRDRAGMKKEQRIDVITKALTDEGIDKDISEKRATAWVKDDRKIIFETSELEGSNFFSIQNTGGILRVKINSNHRAYKNLLLLTESEAYKDMDDSQRLSMTKDGLWLLLASWARFEDLIKNRAKRQDVQDIRFDWGKELNIFLEQNES